MQHQRNTSAAAIKEQLLSGNITLAQLSIAEVEQLLDYEIDQISSECLCNDDFLLACTKCLEEANYFGKLPSKEEFMARIEELIKEHNDIIELS
jgi:hypothetical protein